MQGQLDLQCVFAICFIQFLWLTCSSMVFTQTHCRVQGCPNNREAVCDSRFDWNNISDHILAAQPLLDRLWSSAASASADKREKVMKLHRLRHQFSGF